MFPEHAELIEETAHLLTPPWPAGTEKSRWPPRCTSYAQPLGVKANTSVKTNGSPLCYQSKSSGNLTEVEETRCPGMRRKWQGTWPRAWGEVTGRSPEPHCPHVAIAALRHVAGMIVRPSFKFHFILANLSLKTDTSVIEKLLSVFGMTWIHESTFFYTINSVKSKYRVPVSTLSCTV